MIVCVRSFSLYGCASTHKHLFFEYKSPIRSRQTNNNPKPCLNLSTANLPAKPTAKPKTTITNSSANPTPNQRQRRHPWNPRTYPSTAGPSPATNAKSPWPSSCTSATPTTKPRATRPSASSSMLSGARWMESVPFSHITSTNRGETN